MDFLGVKLMLESLLQSFGTEGIFLFRIIIASICGGAIGFERSRRQKDAGIRTHFIVALGSALCIVVSKYGFADVFNGGPVMDAMKVDASRIAANVITGVSFLGAGIIFVKDHTVRGLTTAAGIWVTAIVGLSIGSGLYIVGICSSLILIIIQSFFHKYADKIEGNSSRNIFIEVNNQTDRSFEIGAIITRYGATLHSLEILYADGKTRNRPSDSLILKATVYHKNEQTLQLITSSIRTLDGIRDLYVE